MPPIHEYTNWNSRSSDSKEQIEPYKKYFFICEGANTETYYFRRLIDLRKDLRIHPLIDVRLLEKTDKDRDISFPKHLFDFSKKIKEDLGDSFENGQDKMIIVFDGDIYEEKNLGYDELIEEIEKNDIAAISNPNFELFLCLHIEGFYEKYIQGNENDFMKKDSKGRYSHAKKMLRNLIGMNSKSNPKIGELAKEINTAIKQEKNINEDIHKIKGRIGCNVASIIESIILDSPEN